ncbi:hypothetical protein JYU34_008074 [Plutella xylostella]|uniref:UDP-glucuronosyltransferase n=1 Tax=Plutella xylostella TaxID=51655 RepID=A0ABQ7QNP6_PLUXY|nr:hypothetical protein JYU34_008074 [Plutella xylostella]
MKLLPYALSLAVLFTLTEPARILSVIPTLSRSHYIDGRRILLELARRGHEIVSISCFEEKDAPPNFTWVQIEISSFFDAIPDMKEELYKKMDFFRGQERLWRFTNQLSEYIVNKPILKKFIEEDQSHFDLVLAEEFYQEVFYVFAHKYKAPLVLLSTFGSGHYISEYMGNALELSYVPHEFTDLYGELTFLERAKNLAYTAFDVIARKYFSLEEQHYLAQRVFKNLKDVPHVADLERNASLILINSHFTLAVVRPYLPNIVEIGGVHIEDVKPLEKKLKDVLDGAKNGVVLFSIGSFLELAAQPEPFIRDVLNTLGKLSQVVLLKWNSDEKMPVNYRNIYPMKWLPQNEILAHPNTVAFITHGGLHSAQESVYHGVPTICIPFYGDQPLNCKKSEKMGFGIHISNLTESNLNNALREILTNPSYRDTAKELSRRFKDRPMSALDSATYWIEYVIRHKGANFIKGPKRNLYWFQYYFLDLWLAVLTSLWVILKVLKALLSLVFGKKEVVKASEKKTGKKVKKN